MLQRKEIVYCEPFGRLSEVVFKTKEIENIQRVAIQSIDLFNIKLTLNTALLKPDQ